jgi:limonene-1,2-epoxide hydrolase
MAAVDVVDAFIAALVRMDLDAACAMVTEDCEYDNVPMGKTTGPAGIRDTLGPFVANCETVDWIIHHQVASDDVVMNERTDRFKINGRWMELPVAGLFVVRGDKIALWRDYFDQRMFTKQLQG